MAKLDQQQWDSEILQAGGSFHQSWAWGEFKRYHGWQVERVRVSNQHGTGLAQVLFFKHGPISSATLQRGPVVQGDAGAILPEVFAGIHRACSRHRSFKLNVEPAAGQPFRGERIGLPFQTALRRFTPDRTVIVPLADDETLIRQMHSAKRREIRKAERRGIEILHRGQVVDPGKQFHRLMQETAERNRFPINGESYYETFLDMIGANAIQLFAMTDGDIVAGLIASRTGNEAVYMFGGSSTTGRVPGATALLQFHAMRWARDQGCTSYDLWGIPAADPPAGTQLDGQPLRSIGDDMSGLYRFKVELGGEIVTLPPAFEVQYHPAISWMARNMRQIARGFPRP